MYYHRWSQNIFTRGSYSDVVVNHTAVDFKLLGKNLGRLYFAGEAMSPEWYGYMQGAYLTGRDKGMSIAEAILREETLCSTWLDRINSTRQLAAAAFVTSAEIRP